MGLHFRMNDMANVLDISFKVSLIRKQPIFSKLTDEEVNMLAGLFTEKHYTSGETIVTEGDPVDSFFLIAHGTADVRHMVIEKDHVHLESVATLSEGDAIGLNESGFYSLTGVRTATVVALSDMTLITLTLALFHGFALAYPHVSEIMRNQAREFLQQST